MANETFDVVAITPASLRDLYDAGMTTREVGQHVGLAKGTVLRALRLAGAEIRGRHTEPHDRVALAAAGMKRCTGCRVAKPYSEFRKSTRAQDGHQWQCNGCFRDRHRAKTYGLSGDRFREMLAKQGGSCAACDTAISDGSDGRSTAYVDHDHATGAIRGLLCPDCNTASGLLNDDPNRLIALAEYLLAHRSRKEVRHHE